MLCPRMKHRLGRRKARAEVGAKGRAKVEAEGRVRAEAMVRKVKEVGKQQKRLRLILNFLLHRAQSQKSKPIPRKKRPAKKKSRTDLSQHSLPEATAPAAVEPTPKRRKGNPDAVKASPAAPVVKPPKKGGEENKKGKVAKTSKHQDEREKYDIPTYTHCAINAYWSRDAVGVKLKVGGKLGKEAGFVTCAMYIICRTKAKSL